MRDIARNHRKKIWRVGEPAPDLCRILSKKLNISRILAQILVNRGVYTVDQARAFLDCGLERLHDPLLLTDMGKAACRIVQAAGAGEKILVYGDYDADGITATVLMIKLLRRIGANADYYVPDRLNEGYGVHLDVLKKAVAGGVRLVVTVDCGISAVEESVWAADNGLEMIITDHHEPSPVLPGAFAVVNPKRRDCKYPFRELAGAGVALKLAQAALSLLGAGSDDWMEYLDLACVGTIADIVPLLGENRILVKHGLPRLAETGNPGLQALMEASGLNGSDVDAREVGFGLVPRLNAAGRVGNPALAVELLLAEDIGEARELAGELNRRNQVRQKIEADVLGEAVRLIEEGPEPETAPAIVLASENWHPGVTGIVASRIAERYHRPVFLIALEGGVGKGSARSTPEFDLYKALTHCGDYLDNYGGHTLAAGFTINGGNIDKFRETMLSYAGQVLGGKELVPKLNLDCIVGMDQLSEKLAAEIQLLQPFGQGNPEPLLACMKASVLESRTVGKESSHLRLRLRGNIAVFNAIGFNLSAHAGALASSDKVDLAFAVGVNEFNGRRSLQLEIKDLVAPAALELTGESRSGRVSEELLPKPLAGHADSADSLFVPEFVGGVLKGLKLSGRPECAGGAERVSRAVDFVDLRNLLERQSILKELAVEGGRSLVITACGYQVVELEHYLRLAGPWPAGSTAFCHGGVSGPERSRISEMFKAGKLSALVATPDILSFVGESASRVFLYHLPFSPATVNSAIAALKPGGMLYLLCNSEDYRDNIENLDTIAPERGILAYFYKELVRMWRRGGAGAVEIDTVRFTGLMKKAGFLNFRRYTAEIALMVLEELGLIRSCREENRVRVRLLPPPEQKKDLMEARTYRHLHQIKEDSTKWMRKFLNEPSHSFLNVLHVTSLGG